MASSKAIVCHDTYENGGWKMEEVGLRPLQEGELLVEMVATGVCHTDALIGGIPGGAAPIAFYPRILGHEGMVDTSRRQVTRLICSKAPDT